MAWYQQQPEEQVYLPEYIEHLFYQLWIPFKYIAFPCPNKKTPQF